jgi:hypothetical protein
MGAAAGPLEYREADKVFAGPMAAAFTFDGKPLRYSSLLAPIREVQKEGNEQAGGERYAAVAAAKQAASPVRESPRLQQQQLQRKQSAVQLSAAPQADGFQREAAAPQADGFQPDQLQLWVQLDAFVDRAILDDYLSREGKQQGLDVSAFAATGTVHSFVSTSAIVHDREERVLESTLKGEIPVKLPLRFPRDLDLIEQLRVNRGLRRKAVAAREAAKTAVTAPASAVAATVDSEEATSHLITAWAEHTGGIPYFVNASAATGFSVVLPGGRTLLPAQTMVDTACLERLVGAQWVKDAGISTEQLPAARYLMFADGRISKVTRVARKLVTILKAGTPEELVCPAEDFLVTEGLDSLCQITFGAKQQHDVGSGAVDRFTRTMSYRPFLASKGDSRTQATVPVRCWKQEGAPAAMAGVREISPALAARLTAAAGVAAATVADPVTTASEDAGQGPSGSHPNRAAGGKGANWNFSAAHGYQQQYCRQHSTT